MMERRIASPVQPDSQSAATADRMVTSREAADVLNVSRSYVVRLLESGTIRFTTVGTYQRIRLADLLEYKARMDADADRAARELVGLSQEMGLYDVGVNGLPGPDGYSAAQVAEVMRRSASYHQNPERAVPLHEALDRIERLLAQPDQTTSAEIGSPSAV